MPEHGFTVDCLGHRIDITIAGDGADELVGVAVEAWEQCLVEEPPTTDGHHIEVDVRAGAAVWRSATAVSAPSHEAAMEMLSQAVTLAGVSASAGKHLMLHAAGLANTGTGGTAVLVGPSGMGKSTATRALGDEWGYVSDETVAMTAEGAIVGYPKPLSLIEGGRWKRQASPHSLGLLQAPAALQPACLVLLNRRPAGAVKMRDVPLTEAVARAAQQTSYLAELDRPLQRIASLVRQAGCVEVTYSETPQLRDALRELMAREP